MSFSAKESIAFEATVQAIDQAIARMESLVPPPTWTRLHGDRHAFRYIEHGPHQALVLKSVRLSSALRAGRLLLLNGLLLDAGAIMRVMDELGSDIMFIAGPILSKNDAEPRHFQYLEEFFQEEFDHADPLKATQSRNRVLRKHIRAYLARAYDTGFPVSQSVAVSETIESTFSGYVHGASVHIMDIYDGKTFVLPLQAVDRPLADMMRQYINYAYRALMAIALAAMAFGKGGPYEEVYRVIRSIFTEDGRVRD